MKLLGYLLIGLIVLSCNSKTNQSQKIKKPVFSEEEQQIINNSFKPDTTNKEIESIKIQTH